MPAATKSFESVWLISKSAPGSNTVILKVIVSLRLGVPSSVTLTVTSTVSTVLVAQTKSPVVASMLAPLGALTKS